MCVRISVFCDLVTADGEPICAGTAVDELMNKRVREHCIQKSQPFAK